MLILETLFRGDSSVFSKIRDGLSDFFLPRFILKVEKARPIRRFEFLLSYLQDCGPVELIKPLRTLRQTQVLIEKGKYPGEQIKASLRAAESLRKWLRNTQSTLPEALCESIEKFPEQFTTPSSSDDQQVVCSTSPPSEGNFQSFKDAYRESLKGRIVVFSDGPHRGEAAVFKSWNGTGVKVLFSGKSRITNLPGHVKVKVFW